jgi:hypothetical protein
MEGAGLEVMRKGIDASSRQSGYMTASTVDEQFVSLSPGDGWDQVHFIRFFQHLR